MVMSLDEPIRQLIDGFTDGSITMPVRIGSGNAYFVPGKSRPWYLVVDVSYTDKGNRMRGMVCACTGFMMNREDECYHIRRLRESLDTGIKVTRKKKR